MNEMNTPVSSTPKAKIVRPGEGNEVLAFGNAILFKLGEADTGGALSLGFSVIPPGHGPPMHVHHSDDEIFIVLKGEFEYTAGGETHQGGPGCVVYLPKDCPHTFKCISEEPGEMIVITTPGGFDRFYERCAAEFATGRPDFAKLTAIAADHGYEFLKPE
jgi:quercetin dioxygenase-like cupin family protein